MTRSESPVTSYILSLLLTLIFIGLSFQNKLNWLIIPTNTILTPLRSPFTSMRISLNHNLEFISNLPHQQRLIDDLKRQNAELSVSTQNTNELKKENDALKELLGSKISPNHRVVTAKVIGFSRFATLNQGSNAGVTPDLPVVQNDILVGIATQVSPNTTRVRLLNDPDTSIEVITLTGITGKLTFQNNSLTLTQVPQKDTLNQDEPIFTKGENGLPDGLLIGHISQVNNNESSIYQSATITGASKVSQSQYLFVLLD